ncbi:FAD-dependent oxidoreductase [Candidatus Daviesbacteria bacterium]|nr:FAD-dependent oxidoreductase [Candidatus Daviesbacteria bacterium]
MKGKIIDKKEIATGTLQVTFAAAEPFTFKAGQYVFVTLINPPYFDERSSKRHFSIVNSPDEKGIITIATRLRDSGFKKSLKELPVGAEVELGSISGSFVLPDDTAKPLVFIAGGIGITPYMSMLKYAAENKLPYRITLVYSNRDSSSSAYLQELANFKAQMSNFKLILTMTEDPDWSGEKRKIDAGFIKEYFPDLNENLYFVVGPPPMVEAVQKALLEAGVDIENISIENFTGY